MRFFEITPLKLLLIPLVPAAALGIVTIAATLTAPTQTQATTENVRQPCTFVSRRVSPPPPPAPAPCTDCRTAAPA